MTERFTILSSYLGLYKVFDNENYEPLADWEITDLMNKLVKENKKLKEENQQLRELLEYGLEVSQVEIDEELRRRKK